ncbi:MAG: hypothetical protein ACYC92_00250 [Candidatus Acidiferrales bacterium]
MRFDGEQEHKADPPAGEETLWYTSDILDASGNPALHIWKRSQSGEYRMHYSHGLTFQIDANLANIAVRCDGPMVADDVAAFLLGPVMGVVLRLRGVTCLHASAVSLRGKAVAFVGIAGAGKSTTAALFAQKGHAVLSDDIVAMFERESSFHVLPAYPYLNLWPWTIEMLSRPADAVPPGAAATDAVDKLRMALGTEGTRFQGEPLRLAAIYVLSEPLAESRTPRVEDFSRQSALMKLVANTYGNTILDAPMRAEEFRVLSRLTKSVPIRHVSAPHNASQLPGLYEVICDDFARVVWDGCS